MKEKYRQICYKLSRKLGSKNLSIRFSPYYYQYARNNIQCQFLTCKCPHRDAFEYSFVYIDEMLKLIYFDVPKCASSTIRELLFSDDNSLSMKNPEKGLNSYFKFAFIRNPWDRMVSNWKMFTTKPYRIKQLMAMTSKNLTDFKDFVGFALQVKNHHWQPQVLYLPEDLNFIGRFESFNEDFQRLLKTVGVETLSIKHLNKTPRKKYHEYYTTKLVDLVAEMYAEDIRRFGYSFEEV